MILATSLKQVYTATLLSIICIKHFLFICKRNTSTDNHSCITFCLIMKLYGLVLLLCLNSWGFGKCHGHAHHCNLIISCCDIPQRYVSTSHHTFDIIFIGASLSKPHHSRSTVKSVCLLACLIRHPLYG